AARGRACLPLIRAKQESSTPPTTGAFSDQMMQVGAGRLWTSLGQSPGLQMAWRRLPVFRSDMRRHLRQRRARVGRCGTNRSTISLPESYSLLVSLFPRDRTGRGGARVVRLDREDFLPVGTDFPYMRRDLAVNAKQRILERSELNHLEKQAILVGNAPPTRRIGLGDPIRAPGG